MSRPRPVHNTTVVTCRQALKRDIGALFQIEYQTGGAWDDTDFRACVSGYIPYRFCFAAVADEMPGYWGLPVGFVVFEVLTGRLLITNFRTIEHEIGRAARHVLMVKVGEKQKFYQRGVEWGME